MQKYVWMTDVRSLRMYCQVNMSPPPKFKIYAVLKTSQPCLDPVTQFGSSSIYRFKLLSSTDTANDDVTAQTS